MRCPKCGFISFDHLDTCLKCKKDIKSTSESLHGSVYNVAAPSFLKFNTDPEPAEVDLPEAFIDADDAFADEEIHDPDLDILLDEDSEDAVGEFDLDMGTEEPEEGIDISLVNEEEEDADISFGLDQFDDEGDLPGLENTDDDEVAEKPLSMGLPEELSDISDLEQPAALAEVAEEPEAGGVDDDFDLDLDFDLNFDDEQDLASAKSKEADSDFGELSLGELDLTDEPKAAVQKKKPRSHDIDLDDDLNFDLDLGDLRLDDDEKI